MCVPAAHVFSAFKLRVQGVDRGVHMDYYDRKIVTIQSQIVTGN